MCVTPQNNQRETNNSKLGYSRTVELVVARESPLEFENELI